jgi:hypothetical protein
VGVCTGPSTRNLVLFFPLKQSTAKPRDCKLASVPSPAESACSPEQWARARAKHGAWHGPRILAISPSPLDRVWTGSHKPLGNAGLLGCFNGPNTRLYRAAGQRGCTEAYGGEMAESSHSARFWTRSGMAWILGFLALDALSDRSLFSGFSGSRRSQTPEPRV